MVEENTVSLLVLWLDVDKLCDSVLWQDLGILHDWHDCKRIVGAFLLSEDSLLKLFVDIHELQGFEFEHVVRMHLGACFVFDLLPYEC